MTLAVRLAATLIVALLITSACFVPTFHGDGGSGGGQGDGGQGTGGFGGTATGGNGAGGGDETGGDTSTGGVDGTGGDGTGTGGTGAVGTGGGAGSGGTGGTGGTPSGGGTAGTGGVSTGGTSSGGSGGAQTIGPLGEACTDDGAEACAAHASLTQVVCEDDLWTDAGTCEVDQRCDTSEGNVGACVDVVDECLGEDPGAPVCRDTYRFDCGPDLVTEVDGETCAGGCVAGVCTECQPLDDACSGNGTVECLATGEWDDVVPCSEDLPSCQGAICQTPPSCVGLAANCGVGGGESCCVSTLIDGDDFDRGNDPTFPATVADFRLDRYEVTVGRFRNFVSAVVGGWRPPAGSGIHEHLGEGLVDPTLGGNETGWDTAWNSHLPSSVAVWSNSSYLACESTYDTWTSGGTGNENLPINCVNWYQAYAFCIWDGGFLPSEAEWNYAAAGGDQQWSYPWSNVAPGNNADLAAYGCYYGGGAGTCSSTANIAPVGQLPNEGLWDQLDLAGNLWEWTADWDAAYANPCTNCAAFADGGGRTEKVRRGGGFSSPANQLLTSFRMNDTPSTRWYTIGLRCARSP